VKLESCLNIRCKLPDDHNKIALLENALEGALRRYWVDVVIDVTMNAPLLKYENRREIIFNITHDKPISVCDAMKIFPVSWIYSKGFVFDVHTQESVEEEEALWNKSCNPSESFLTSDVEWVCMYTWLD
jgi:hypothetical protein